MRTLLLSYMRQPRSSLLCLIRTSLPFQNRKMTECPSWSSEFELLLNGFEDLKSSSSLENPDHHLAGTGRQIGLHGAHSGYGHGCCPLVFNPSTLLALLAGIALATYFLRLVSPICIWLLVSRNFLCVYLFHLLGLCQNQNLPFHLSQEIPFLPFFLSLAKACTTQVLSLVQPLVISLRMKSPFFLPYPTVLKKPVPTTSSGWSSLSSNLAAGALPLNLGQAFHRSWVSEYIQAT